MEDQIDLMVTYLVHLQFYSQDTDELVSRDKKTKISIHGIGPIVDAFKFALLDQIDLIKAGNYREYLAGISNSLPIDIDIIEADFTSNTSQLSSGELSPELLVNFLVGPIRSNLQNREFEKAIEDILFLAFMREKTLKPQESLRAKLREMYEQNDSCVAMLYNLVFLRLLVSIYGDEELKYRVNGWVTKYSNDLVSRIVS